MLDIRAIRESCGPHAQAHPDEAFYGLVDHAGMPGLDRKLRLHKAEWVSLFDGTRQANAVSVAPLLFRFDMNSHIPRQESLLTWVSKRGEYTSTLIVLASPLSIRHLAARLSARLDATISENMDVLLRFYDPRVFEQLARVLATDQLADFLSPARAWWFVNRCGQLKMVAAAYAAEDSFNSPLMLTSSQEFGLLDASEADQIASQLQSSLPSEYAQLPLLTRHEFITLHLTAARQIGISSTFELSLYCALALLYGADFAERPEWRSLLEEIRAGQRSLSDAVADLTEPFDK